MKLRRRSKPETLPDASWREIFQFCRMQDVLRFACVCVKFRSVASSAALWDTLWKQEYPKETIPPGSLTHSAYRNRYWERMLEKGKRITEHYVKTLKKNVSGVGSLADRRLTKLYNKLQFSFELRAGDQKLRMALKAPVIQPQSVLLKYVAPRNQKILDLKSKKISFAAFSELLLRRSTIFESNGESQSWMRICEDSGIELKQIVLDGVSICIAEAISPEAELAFLLVSIPLRRLCQCLTPAYFPTMSGEMQHLTVMISLRTSLDTLWSRSFEDVVPDTAGVIELVQWDDRTRSHPDSSFSGSLSLPWKWGCCRGTFNNVVYVDISLWCCGIFPLWSGCHLVSLVEQGAAKSLNFDDMDSQRCVLALYTPTLRMTLLRHHQEARYSVSRATVNV